MGKGDWYRPVDKKKFDENYEAMFGKREIKTWNPDEDEEQHEDSPEDNQSGH